jgi:nucleoside 2-deoxyribosyltransferase
MGDTYDRYKEKLKNPKWQEKRLEIMNRDGFTCQLCRDKSTMQCVHHMKYTADEPWDEPDHNLITLCEECHKLVENYKQFRSKTFSVYCAGRVNKYGDGVSDWRTKMLGVELSHREILSEYKIYHNRTYIGPEIRSEHGEECLDGTFERCLNQISKCNLFYCYISDLECYGTLFELGYAAVNGRFIILVIDDEVDDSHLWFAKKSAHIIIKGKPDIDHIINPYNAYMDELIKRYHVCDWEIRQRIIADGGLRYQYVCSDCGKVMSQSTLKKDFGFDWQGTFIPKGYVEKVCEANGVDIENLKHTENSIISSHFSFGSEYDEAESLAILAELDKMPEPTMEDDI